MKKTSLLFALLFAIGCSPKLNLPEGNFVFFMDKTILGKASFRGVAVANDIAVVAGSGGQAYLANLNKKKWTRLNVTSDDNIEFRDVEILDGNTILLMSAGEGKASKIFKSNDAGKSWKMVFENQHEKAFFNGFDFWDNKHGVLISDPIDDKLYLLETKDGGETWQRLQSPILPQLNKNEYGFAASGTGIKCFAIGELRVATGGATARVFSSSNYGKKWTIEKPSIIQGGDSKGIFSIDYLDSKTGIAVGGNYQADTYTGDNLCLYQNKKWLKPKGAEVLQYASCAQYLNQNMVLATGTSGTAISNDGGANWNYLPKIEPYHAISYDTENNIGLLSGGNGRTQWFKLLQK